MLIIIISCSIICETEITFLHIYCTLITLSIFYRLAQNVPLRNYTLVRCQVAETRGWCVLIDLVGTEYEMK